MNFLGAQGPQDDEERDWRASTRLMWKVAAIGTVILTPLSFVVGMTVMRWVAATIGIISGIVIVLHGRRKQP